MLYTGIYEMQESNTPVNLQLEWNAAFDATGKVVVKFGFQLYSANVRLCLMAPT